MGSKSHHAELARIYDRFAATYEQNRGLFDMTDILDDFCRHLDGPGKLLDLGCGAGEPFAKTFVDCRWDVTGVDFSNHMLELARRFVPGMKTIHADMCAVQFDAGQFDAITAIYSMFHVPRTAHAKLFDSCHRWLRPGGYFLFTYATRSWTGADRFDGYKEFMGERLYYSHERPDELWHTLSDVGFDIVSAEDRSIGGETFLWVTVRKKPQ
jgi:SAM-dependent methyltransferase